MKFDQATKIWRSEEVNLLKREWGKDLKGKKVLDLGCGEGEIAKEIFGESFGKLRINWGLDNDKEMVRKAKKSRVYKRVILGDAGKMPLKDGEVDLVFSNSVLEHIEQIREVLGEVSRVLKRGGVLVATMPSHKLVEYIGWGKLYGKLFNKKYEHYHLYSASKWRKLLRQAELELADHYYYLDKETAKQWHRCLWLNKLGLKGKVKSRGLKRLSQGAGIAIKAKKL